MNKNVNIIIPQYPNFKQEIILFEGLEDISPVTIHLPDPPNKRDIINHHRATSSQKWERIKLPKSFEKYKSLPKERIYSMLNKEEHDFIKEEYKKIEFGHWFLNNGKLTYLTDDHYFYLNWWTPDFGRPVHKETDRKFFYHWEKVEKNENSYGLIEMTRRRQGKSARAGVIAYKRTFSNNNQYCGIQSKTDTDAAKFFQKTIVLPWKRLPFFFQPNFDNSNNPRYELRFFSQTKRGKNSQESIGVDDSLESWIEARSSVETAFDGEKLHTSIDDEAGKLIECSISERWDIKKHCLEVDGKIIGKELMTTTVEEMEHKGGKQFKEIWDGADPSQLDELQRTQSGLHRHFTPAYEGYHIDEYGNNLIESSVAELNARRESLKSNPSKLTAFKRRFPFTIKEAFRSSGKECHFNIEIIDTRLEDFTFENKFLTWGDFKWKDGKQDGEVIFMPKAKGQGKFVISYLFPDPREANKILFHSGRRLPGNTTNFIAGGDPFKYRETLGNVRSNGAGAVFMKRNALIDTEETDMTKWTTNRFVATYCNRPNKYEYGEDMIMMCHYYGCLMFPEINVDFLWDYFEERGYGGYLYYQKDNNNRRARTPGANTNDSIKDAIFTEFDDHIEKHGMREVHQEILETCREVEYDKLSPYDLFVSCGYALLGARKTVNDKPVVKNTTHKLFNTYQVI